MLESGELDESLQGKGTRTENEHIIYVITGPDKNVHCKKEPKYDRNK